METNNNNETHNDEAQNVDQNINNMETENGNDKQNEKQNENENETLNDSVIEIERKKINRVVKVPESDIFKYKKVRGDRDGSVFLYTFDEKQLYIFKDRVRLGETWRCSKYRELKCNSRVIIRPNGDCIKLKSAPAHSHACDSEQRYKNCLALNATIKKCKDLGSMANGPQLAKTSAVFTSVMVE